MPDNSSPDPEPHAARRRWMSILARAGAEEIAALLQNAPALPAYVRLRGPEAGLVMLRGRAGGGGAAFNLGEMTVTRCTVRIADGPLAGWKGRVIRRDGELRFVLSVDLIMRSVEVKVEASSLERICAATTAAA